MPTLKLFDTVSKTLIIPFVSLNLIQKHYQGFQLELLKHHVKFDPDQFKSVPENEADRFYFALTL